MHKVKIPTEYTVYLLNLKRCRNFAFICFKPPLSKSDNCNTLGGKLSQIGISEAKPTNLPSAHQFANLILNT